ncbi:phosphoribosyl-ATP diphosphatase [Roseococcus sp. YIM B11640]|uniref:phosphoribosyl-ATP diphosphatase n=1 Tax=Roseococcus sp. YIM B11640 TaxID=3133973 RepID=UPI003C7DA631
MAKAEKKTKKADAKALKAVKPAKKTTKRARVPMPADVPAKKARVRKAVLRAEASHLKPLELPEDGNATVLDRLWATIEARRAAGDAAHSHSARLMARGTAKVAQKLGEEAVELVIEAVSRNRHATIAEAADVLYHLMVVLVDAGIGADEVWAELRRREGISGIMEKASRPKPKGLMAIAQTSKLP